MCPSLCATFRILLSFFRRALDTKWLEFSTAAMYVLFLSRRVSPTTHIKPCNVKFIVLKKFTFGLKLLFVVFSKINKSFFHSFFCFCIPRKKSQGLQSPRRGPELQALAILGILDPTIRAKSDCGCARSLNSFWPPILRSQRPKKMFLC